MEVVVAHCLEYLERLVARRFGELLVDGGLMGDFFDLTIVGLLLYWLVITCDESNC